MSNSELLRTAEVLERTGITHQILYRYITLGLIEPASTTEKGLRFFHPNVILLIEIIKSISRDGGYSLRDLKDIFFKDERVKKLTHQTKSSS
jgi:DNA-binding transcriptional MerR regulator